MQRHVGFYVHHRGRGHVTRVQAILRHLDLPTTVLTSANVDPSDLRPADVLQLPLDLPDAGEATAVPTPEHLHYAPLGVRGLRDRTARIATFFADVAPALLVVDVSAEVAQLGRLAGVPTVVIRQHGARWDAAHRAAYDGAVGLLAPFGPELEEPDVPEEVRVRTFYAGGLGRGLGDLPRSGDGTRHALGRGGHARVVVVLCGAGGDGPTDDDLVAAADATPDARWVVVGDRTPGGRLASTGWVEDPMPYLAAADIVVGSAGHNTVMEVAAVGRPFVCVPERRPFAEQERKGARLAALDAATVVPAWPAPRDWPGILEEAACRGAAGLRDIADGQGAARAAGWLDALTQRFAS